MKNSGPLSLVHSHPMFADGNYCHERRDRTTQSCCLADRAGDRALGGGLRDVLDRAVSSERYRPGGCRVASSMGRPGARSLGNGVADLVQWRSGLAGIRAVSLGRVGLVRARIITDARRGARAFNVES